MARKAPLPADDMTAFQNEPVNFLLSNALRHLTQDQQRQLCNALLERLPSPADLEQEAKTLYPLTPELGEFDVAKVQQATHITAARQYMGEIERLTRENHKLMAENDANSEELGELKNITDGLDARVINQKADLLIAYRNKIALTPGITVETILAMLEDDIKTLRAMGGAEIVKIIIDPSNDKA